MANTTFTDGVTLTDDEWFNHVNDAVYEVLGDGTTPPSTAVAAMKNLFKKGADIASAATVNLAAATGNYIHVTGTTTITSFGTVNSGVPFMIVFDGALTLTHNATSLILVSGGNRVTVPGETVIFVSESSGNWREISSSSPQISFPAMWIQGLIPSNNGADATNDLDFTAGQCRDATNTRNIVVAALTKRSDANWAVGTNQGMLDTGAIGNAEYYVWAILRSDTGVTDLLCSLSSTAPTMPTNYDYKRLVGYFLRVGGTIVTLKATETEGGGLDWLWTVPTLDINLANTLTTSRRTDAVKVPLTFSVTALLNAVINDSVGPMVFVYCPDQSDAAPSDTVAPFGNLRMQVAGQPAPSSIVVRTSSAGLIAARANVATVDLYAVVTLGFTWARRN